MCFICSLDATGKLERELVLKSNENVWQAHIEREHNWRNYIFYLTYLLQKTGYAARMSVSHSLLSDTMKISRMFLL